MMPDTWTPPELVRAIQAAQATLGRIETKLDTRPTEDQVNEKLSKAAEVQALKDQLQDKALSDLQDEVSRVTSWFTWAGRLVGGVLGAAVLGVVLVKPA